MYCVTCGFLLKYQKLHDLYLGEAPQTLNLNVMGTFMAWYSSEASAHIEKKNCL